MRNSLKNLIAVLAPLVAVGLLNGAQVTTLRFPAFAYVEGEPVRTAMLIRLQARSYGPSGVPLDEFGKAATDEQEQTALSYLDSIRTSTVSTFRDLDYDPPAKKSGPHYTNLMSPEKQIALYRRIFDDFRNVRLECRFTTDNGELFVWKAGTSHGWLRRGLLVFKAANKMRVHEADMDYPTEAYIVESLGHLPGDSLEQSAVAPTETRALSLKLSTSGCALEFDGQRLDADVSNRAATLPPAGEVYRTAIAKWRAGDLEGVSALYTKQSSAKIREGASEWYPTLRRLVSKPKYIKFVVDADPVFIVFTASAGGNQWNDTPEHEYVLRDGDAFKVTNFFFSAPLDALFQYSPFLPRFLKQTAAAKVPSRPARTRP